jgi:hypothetical protein
MRFPCPSCAKELAIPDEKLPQADRFIVNCPDCLEKLVIDKASMANPVRLMNKPSPVEPVLEDTPSSQPLVEEPQSVLGEDSEEFGMGVSGVSGISYGPTTGVSIVQEPAPPPEDVATVGVPQAPVAPVSSPVPESGAPVSAAPAVPAAPAPGPSGDRSSEPEIFPPGSKVVFFFLTDSDWSQEARAFFQEQGYHVSTATDSGEAAAKLRLNAYNVLLIEDSEEGRLLLREVANWSGVRRRECNVALLGEGSPSLDPQSAFRWGVNSWLKRADAGRCSELLGEVLKGYELHYELLRMAMQQDGAE